MSPLVILERTMRFGLSKNEAKVYLALLKTGEGTADWIARQSAVARQEAYRILSNLEELGLVVRVVAMPTVFKSITVHTALGKLIGIQKRRSEANLAELNQTLIQIAKQVDSVVRQAGVENDYAYIMRSSRIVDREIELIREAKKDLVLAAPSSDLIELNDRGNDLIARKLSHGSPVSVICTRCPTDSAMRVCDVFDVRCERGYEGHLLLADGRVIKKIDENTALESNRPMLVRPARFVIEIMMQHDHIRPVKGAAIGSSQSESSRER